MKKVLITGAAGFVGKYVVSILQKKYQIYAVSRNKQENTPNVKWIRVNFDKAWDSKILPSKVDMIIHLAQSESFRDFPDSAFEVFNVNTVSTLKLLDYARKAGVKKFIYTSSGGVENLEKNLTEINFYLTSKLISELLVRNYKNFFDIVIIRPFFMYGEGSKKDLLIERLINLIKNRQPIFLEGMQGIKINPIYVEDAAWAIVNSLKLEGNHTIDLAGNEVFTIKKIADIIGKYLKINPRFKVLKTKKTDLIGDFSQTLKLYRPKFSFRHRILKLLENE